MCQAPFPILSPPFPISPLTSSTPHSSHPPTKKCCNSSVFPPDSTPKTTERIITFISELDRNHTSHDTHLSPHEPQNSPLQTMAEVYGTPAPTPLSHSPSPPPLSSTSSSYSPHPDPRLLTSPLDPGLHVSHCGKLLAKTILAYHNKNLISAEKH